MLKMSRKPSKKLAKLVLATLLFTGWAQLAISPAVVEAGSFASAPTITGTVVKDGGTPVTINIVRIVLHRLELAMVRVTELS